MEWMSNPGITRYNLPMYVPFSKNIPLDRLEHALRTIVSARKVLRTRFVLDEDGLPRQYAVDDMPFDIPRKCMSADELEKYIKDGFVRPYDLLSGEPLFRIELVETPTNHIILFEVHHVIADGLTLAPNLTLKDMPAAYNGESLKEIPYGMYEYAEDEQATMQTEAYERSKAYYAEHFSGREFTTLSRSAANPLGRSIHEDSYMDSDTVDAWCQANGTASNLLYMAAFSYVLAEASREDEIVYRTINHGRMDKRLLDAYGMFVKSSPVLSIVNRQQTVIDFIKGFRRELMSSIRYGSYPFSHFCRDLKMSGGVEFGFQGYKIQEFIELDGEKAFAHQIDLGKSSSDLTCIIYLRDGKYDIRLSSSDALNSREDLQRLARAIKATAENMMAQPTAQLSTLSMLDEEGLQQIESFRFTAKAEVPYHLFYEPIENNAISYADRKALVAKDRTLTFAELNAEANKVAHALLRRGLKRGDRVVLLLPRTSAVIVSMFGASKAGAAYIPCDPAYPSERINLIVNDSEAPYIITTHDHAADYPAEKVIAIDDIYGPKSTPQTGDEQNPQVEVSPDDLAYLIYTSGSTGRPKGVMLRHVGITNYLYDHPANVHIHGLKELDVKTFVSITTLSFDMSLKEFAGSLFNGITCVLADEQEVMDASLLADLMKRTGAEAINGTCSRILSYMELPAFCEALSHCKAVWAGGEKFPMQLLTSLQSMGVHIFNTYGPTEITVSSNIKDLTNSRKVTVGHPLLNYEEFIVDTCGNLLPVGFTGELLIGGPGVARGYNNLPEMTAERFGEYQGIRIYRSGDLARWEPDGDVEILGRNDGQVKLRGFRIELGEVEGLAVKFDGIRQTVADVKEIGSTQHLCLYYVSDKPVNEDALREFIASSLTEYMVPTVYMRIDAIPLTPNGKTNRKALPTPTLKLEEVIAPETQMEKDIFRVVAEILRMQDFGVTNDLISLGLSSLAAMRLSAAIKKQLDIQLLMKDIMQHPTVRQLTTLAENARNTIQLKPHEKRQFYPMNESQRGMYVDWMMNPDALQYNIPILLHFRGVDTERLKVALVEVANAHPYIKTRLALKDDDVVQVRDDDAPVKVEVEQLTHMPDREWFQARVRPFDLLNEPLYRFNIYSCADHVFMLLDLHHIISDGSSNYVIAHELEKAYRGERLSPETYTAFDRALDEEALMESDRRQEAEDYFDQLVGGIDATVYPHSSQSDGDRRQGVVDVYIDAPDIDAFCQRQALPTSSFFLAVFHQVLHRITREENTLIYFISNGRSELLLDNFFGVLVKTLPTVCSQFKGQMSEVARELTHQMQETIRNDFYPFTKLVERHGLKAEILYNYFVDLQTDVCLGTHHSEEIYGLDWDMAKTPLSITMLRADDGIGYIGRIEYDATLYNRHDMHILGDAFKALSLDSCTAAGNELANCRIIQPGAYDALLQLCKGETYDYDPDKTFVSLFMQRAQETPEAPAVVDEEGTYTYQQLDKLSNALALRLREVGVGSPEVPSPFVSIMLGYEKAFLVAAIGIEKAGGAYVPLDYEYPNERLLYMLEDSESQVLITSHAILQEKSSSGDKFEAKNILFIDDFLEEVRGLCDTAACSTSGVRECEAVNYARPDGLAYMIYTSGSTGKPKGVMIPHRAKANFVQFIAQEWRHTSKSRICCHSSFSFDASIEDLYPVLTVGGTLYTVPKEARKDLVMLHDFIVDNHITGGCYTTQLGQMLLQLYPDLPVDYLVVGGEKMTANPDCNCRLINTYGPTEFTVDATFYELEKKREYKNIPIGRPLYNLSAFVVDAAGQLAPQGVAGELCMAGPQIACGYWKREELTAEKFTDCPFMDGKMYHTGDLVRYNEDGQIEYLGRIDSQVKLRGFRIELGEIETLIGKYEGIQMESVQVREIGGVQHLCAYYTADKEIDKDALRNYLAEQLTDYMVPTAYMQLETMPLTPNGKVNAKALPNPNVQAEELVAPVTKTEKAIFQLAADMLKHDNFGITNNLISMGLTSLTAMRFTVAVYKQFGIQVSVKEVLQNPTIHQLAAFIDTKRVEEGLDNQSANESLWSQGKHYYYPITENQRGVFLDWELNRDTTQYNVPDVHILRGGDAERLCLALKTVVNAHPYLKTRFVQHEGDVMQIRRDEEEPELLVETLSEQPDEAFFQSRVRPFDLYNDTLYRLEVYTYDSDVYLFIDIHHVIYDGASSIFLLNDIKKAYQGDDVQAESYSAFDFALDEYKLVQSARYAEAEHYFQDLLEGLHSTVYPRSKKGKDSEEGQKVVMPFEGRAITAFCRNQAVTPNNYFLTVLMHVLGITTNDDHVVITTINNGRADVRTMGIMGMFVKTLPVVFAQDDSRLNVSEAIRHTQQQLIETQSRDFYPFTKMVERYGLRPEIMYVYQPTEDPADDDDLDMHLQLNQTKLPLDVQVMPQGERYILQLEYDEALYRRSQVERLAAMFKQVAVAACHAATLRDIPLLDTDEMADMVKLSQGTPLETDITRTWVDDFKRQAQQTPDHLAVADNDSAMTYAQLDHGSDVVATQLTAMGIQPNQFVCLLLRRSKEIPLAILAIHKAGAAYLPLDMEYPTDRINYMVDNAGASVVITNHATYEEAVEDKRINLASCQIVYIDDLDLNGTCSPINKATPAGLAYAIYTSGTTGKPKGVVLHHAGLYNFTVATVGINHLTADDRISSHRAFSFDAHIEDVFPILTVGGSLHIMPDGIRKDLNMIYNFLEQHKITGGGYTTSIAQLLIKNFDLHQRFITCGGEALIDVVSDKLQVINVYGPTECTDHAAVYHLQKGRTYDVIPIGRPMPNMYCFIVDRYGRLLPRGVEGELCVAGIQVGYGYWQLPEMTEKAFCDCPFISSDAYGRPLRMYHTGDICRWNDEGLLEYVARIDHQVKLRGFRIETDEIEKTALSVDGVRQAVADVRRVGTSPQLVLYYLPSPDAALTEEQLRNAIEASSLPDYMKPSLYIGLDKMPTTASGKIDRKSLPTPAVQLGQVIGASNETESQLLQIAEELLGGETIGVTTNLISAGMTSLTAMRMSAVIKQKTQLYIPVKDILSHPTVKEMAAMASAGEEEETTTHEKLDHYPITENQRGVYIDWELNRETTQYNLPSVMKMSGTDAGILHDALVKVVEAHPYLKARLAMLDDDVVQLRLDDEPAVVELIELAEEPDEAFFRSRVRPFDLFHDRLYRMEVYKTPTTVWYFQDIHHIIFDGGSDFVLRNDLSKVLHGEALQSEVYSAFERALDERAMRQSSEFEEAERWFDGLLEDVEMIRYPLSANPDGAATTNNAYVETEVDRGQIDSYSKEHSVTANNFFLTVLMQVLHRLTREERIAITTISNGRSDPRMHGIVGMFVKTLPVVSCLDKSETFESAVQKMNQQNFASQGHDIYPFTMIAERYKFRSEIMFVFQGGMGTSVVTPGGDLLTLDLDTVKMPIAIMVTEEPGNQYRIQIEYDTHLYSNADISLLANSMKVFAQQVIDGVEKIRDISLVGESEKDSVISLSRGEDLPYDKEQTFVDMICGFAERTPDAIAVIDKDSKMTYGQLHEKSNALASRLIAEGVKPDTFVGVMLYRQKEFITAVLGIMKAGAAYIPMDNEYPTDRLLYMMEDSEAKVLLTTHDIYESKQKEGDFHAEKVIYMDDATLQSPTPPVNLSHPDGLAYMIYTSGSTGKPKGVMLPHRALRAFLAWRIGKIGLTTESRNAEHASFSFDASLDDLLCPLAAGGRLYIVPEELRKDMDGLYDYLKEHRITGMTLSTALGMTLLGQYSNLPLKYLMMGGEKMLPFPKTSIKVINGYGPTEFSVCSSFHVVDQEKDVNIPIGRPVPNSYSFICDGFGHLLPVGAAGELCLSGVQMAKGYWHREELTEERFCDAPFGYKVYHTGDLARWNEEGELEFMGRIDNQVKLRGFRIELGEIENQASLIDGIQSVAAEVREAGGSKHLVLYFTAEKAMDVDSIRELLSTTLTEYMVPDTYMQLDQMPMTPNGKVNRRALPQPVIRSAAEYVEPATESERIVSRAIQEVLGLKQPVGALDSFFAWGGDSIKSIRLVSKLRSEGIMLQVADIMKLKTVRNIAAACGKEEIVIDQSSWSGEVPQTAITRFFFDLNLPKQHHFNQTMFIKASGRLNTEVMKETLQALVIHHDMLRAVVNGGQLYVRSIEEPNLYGWEELDYTEDEAYVENIEKVCRKRQGSISLSKGPLLKVTVFHTPEYDAILMVCHHIVVDGVSWRVLLEDLNTAYSQGLAGTAITLPAKTHSYKVYAETLQQYAVSHELQKEIPYWSDVQNKLMALPNSDTKDSSRKMSVVNAELDSHTTLSITTNAGEAYGADVNDILMTALGRSYYQLTGEKALSVQFEGHGREYIGDNNLLTDRTVGWFTSVYPIVLEGLDGDLRSCLRLTKETMHRIPNKGVGYNILRFFNDQVQYKTDKCALVGFNYLGEMDSEGAGKEGTFTAMTEISSGDDFSPQNVFGPDISINCSVIGGKLKATLAYNVALMSHEQAETLLSGMMKGLQEITAHTAEHTVVEVTATDLGEYEWTDNEFQAVYNRFEALGTPLQRIYPLSPMQEGIALKFMMEPDSLAYRLVSRMALDIVPTEEQLRYALDQLAAKHEVLRTSIVYHEVEQYRQAIVDRKLGLEMKDITGVPDKETTMKAMYKAEQQRGFDMEYGPLFRMVCIKTTETTSEILLAVHHIIVDGWCIGLFMNDLISNLTDAINGNMHPVVPQQSGRYEKFIREVLKKDTEQGLAYWKKLLDGYTTKAVIPSTGIIPENERAKDNVCRVKLEGNDMTALTALAATTQTTINTIVEMAWGMVLQAYNRQNDVVFVKVVSGRNNASEGVEDVVGLFINSIPVRVSMQKGTTIQQALQALQQQAAESNEWDFCPLSSIQQQTELQGELFQSILAFENYDGGDRKEKADIPFHMQMVYSKEESINDITVTAYTNGEESLLVNIEFDNNYFRRSEIQEVADVMKHMLQTIAHHPDIDTTDIIPLSSKATIELAALGKGETLRFDTSKTLVDLFTDQAAKTPDNICVVFGEKRLTFREVDRITDRLAALLQNDYDVQPEMAVGVMIDRSELMFIYPMAIMKAGAAYMPLDFHFPAERLTFMCKDADVRLILSEGNRVKEAIPEYTGQVITNDVLNKLDDISTQLNPKQKARPENMFVILYTSGSTGTPKGVVLEHHNIVNFCHWYTRELELTAQDRALAYANFGFDAHMMDLYPVTSVGGSVYIIPSDMRMDLMAMNEYMEQEGLNVAFMTTQVGYMFATTIENHSLRVLGVGGEKLQPLSKPKFRFYNGYGPTECTLYSTWFNVDDDYDCAYIGRPLTNYQLYVVDQNLRLVPRGAAGELIVAGAGVGRGYLNRPELNDEKFITFMGQKAYRTGDLVRWSPDGNIDFIGRIDGQVKLRGLRIELGEIEARAAKYPDISSTAVDVKEICGTQHICCYFTADTEIDTGSLRDFLAEKLTDYMIPTAYMQMEKLPLTPNGKVNRRALPIPALVVETENVAPETDAEQTLFDIATELLKTDQFGVTDDLTHLGLTSLLGIKLVMMASKRDILIKVDDVMKLKTIRSILQHNMEIVSWAHGYKEEKPVVVLVCGATPYKDMSPYIEELSKNYSVLVFEPIVDHYDYIFQDENIEEVVEMYYALLGTKISENTPIAAFTGHCFGGEIAYRLAIKHELNTGQKAPMIMLDVFWRIDPLVFDEEKLMKLIPQELADKYGSGIRSYTKAMHMYDSLGRQGVPPLYQGELVLFRATETEPDSPAMAEICAAAPAFKDAWHEVTAERSQDNRAFWKQYYPQLEVHDMQAHHMSMLEKKHVLTYVEWLDSFIRNHQ